MIGKLIVGLSVLALLVYGIMWVFTNFSLLEILTWLFIGVACFMLSFILMALLGGAKTDG